MIKKNLLQFIFLLQLNWIQQANSCKNSITKASGSKAGRGKFCSGQLIFEDNFNSLHDTGKWQHENTLSGGGNWEFQWYVDDPENSFTKKGILHIKPTLTSDKFGENYLTSATVNIPSNKCTNSLFYGCFREGTQTRIINPIRSAHLTTKHSFNFKYGILKVKAKIPAGDWLWPSIWLLPKTNAYGPWPRSGEINVMESRGNRDLIHNNRNIGVKQVSSTLHFGSDTSNDAWYNNHFKINNQRGYDKDFHIYKLIWTPNYIQFFVDNNEIGIIKADRGFFNKGNFGENPWSSGTKMAPFDQQFYIALNLAVGGNNGYFLDSAKNGKAKKPWINSSQQAAKDFWDGRFGWLPTWHKNDDRNFQIDYVKVYAL